MNDSSSPASEDLDRTAIRYADTLLAGGFDAGFQVLGGAVDAGLGLAAICDSILARAHARIGKMWEENQITVAEEHRSTEIGARHVDRLAEMFPASRRTGLRAVCCAAPGETHEFGARALAGILRSEGWTVDFLGGDVPAADLERFTEKRSPDLVAVSVTMDEHIGGLAELTRRVAAPRKAPAVMVGGRAVAALVARGNELPGVDLWAKNFAEAIDLLSERFRVSSTRPTLSEYLAGIGHSIRALRKRRGWSQGNLAEAAGVERSFISMIERGTQNVSIGALMKIANAFEVSLDEILRGRGAES